MCECSAAPIESHVRRHRTRSSTLHRTAVWLHRLRELVPRHPANGVLIFTLSLIVDEMGKWRRVTGMFALHTRQAAAGKTSSVAMKGLGALRARGMTAHSDAAQEDMLTVSADRCFTRSRT